MARELLIRWLNDAYEMEQALVPMMQEHARQAVDFPQLQAKIDAHCADSQEQTDELRACIERLGGEVSQAKSSLDAIFSLGIKVSAGLKQDEIIKNLAIDCAAEYMEVSTYEALIEAAVAAGDEQTAELCQRICDDERVMAQWLEEAAPVIARNYLRQQIIEEAEEPVAEPMSQREPAFAESLEPDTDLD